MFNGDNRVDRAKCFNNRDSMKPKQIIDMNLHGKGGELQEAIAGLCKPETHANFKEKYGQKFYDFSFDNFIAPIALADNQEAVAKVISNKLSLFCAAFFAPIEE